MRIGIGYDVHRLVEGRRMVLGGVEVGGPVGPLAHSDGDAVLHAVADAILGAAALGDLGQHFPDTSERWRGADSAEILGSVVRMVADRSLGVVNVDVNILAERPRLSGVREAMRRRIAQLLGLPLERVSVKARTGEGLGAVGAGQAIEVHAAVLLQDTSAREDRNG